MDRGLALVAALVIGGLIAAQPAANEMLARHTGALVAAFTSLVGSALIIGTLLVVTGNAHRLDALSAFRPVHLLGAVAGAAVVGGSIVLIRPLGAAGLAAALVATQLIGSALMDHFGLLGVEKNSISVVRTLGVALLIAGTVMVTSRA